MALSAEALRRYRRQVDARRRRTALALAALWDRYEAYDTADAEAFAAQSRPIIDGAKAATVATSAAMFGLALGIRPPGVRPDDVDAEPRLDFPFLAFWHALKEGRPREEALAAGRSQAEAVGADFVQQTARRTQDAAAEASGKRVRFARVPEPGACDWCKDAADQTYRTARSADFGHDRCHCDVVPGGTVEEFRGFMADFEADVARRSASGESEGIAARTTGGYFYRDA